MSDMNDFPANPEPVMAAAPEVLEGPVMPPPKKSRTTTWIIIAVLVLILLCCCCIVAVFGGIIQMAGSFRPEEIFRQFTY
jgi:hypothetical protein